MTPFLSTTQIAGWLEVSERTVARMVQDGRLPQPVRKDNRICFPAQVIVPQIVQDEDVKFMGGVTLKTPDGPIWFEVIEAQYNFFWLGKQWAIFEDRDGRLHLGDWETPFMFPPDEFEHNPILFHREGGEPDPFPFDEMFDKVATASKSFFEALAEIESRERPERKQQCPDRSCGSSYGSRTLH